MLSYCISDGTPAPVTVTPHHKEVQEGTENVTISCKVGNINATLTSVVWKDIDGKEIFSTDTDYVIDKGTFDNYSQTTTLTVKVVGNTADTNFTCEVTMFDNKTEAAAVHLNVYGE